MAAIPPNTSAEALLHYTGAKCLYKSQGKAWRDLHAQINEEQRETGILTLPTVNEPFLCWTISGDVEFQEREMGGRWLTHRIRKGTFFLTTGGSPYQCRWKVLSKDPFMTVLSFVELPLLQRALQEVFGDEAPKARLREMVGATDPYLSWMMQRVREELTERQASPLRVQSLAQFIATHLARNYAEVASENAAGCPSLPGFKVKRVTTWIENHLAEEFDLERLAAEVSLSKFHFHRLFKQATGSSPAKFQLNARMSLARRLLRESKHSIVAIAADLGYSSPSHFAQVFRREIRMTPTEYRRQQ